MAWVQLVFYIAGFTNSGRLQLLNQNLDKDDGSSTTVDNPFFVIPLLNLKPDEAIWSSTKHVGRNTHATLTKKCIVVPCLDKKKLTNNIGCSIGITHIQEAFEQICCGMELTNYRYSQSYQICSGIEIMIVDCVAHCVCKGLWRRKHKYAFG